MRTLGRIREQAKAHPERAAYRTGDGSVSYGVLWERAERAARTLERLDSAFPEAEGSLPGPLPVLLDGSKSPDAAVAIAACLLAGIPYVPVLPGFPPARLRSVIRMTGARLLLAGPEFPDPEELADAAGCAECGSGLIRLPLAGLGLSSEAEDLPEPEGYEKSRYAYVLFTSGSTGEPKGVPVTRASLDNFVRWIGGLPSLAGPGGATVLGQAPFSFDLSVADFFFALTNGHTAAAFRDEGELARLLPDADFAVMTPSFLRLLLLDRGFRAENYPRLKCVWLCGEVLAPAVARKALEAFPELELVNAYGPTEACCAVCAVRIDGRTAEEADPLPVGELSGAAAEISVRDGEIVLRGPSVFGGYLGGAEGGHFLEDGENCFRTGDLGRIDTASGLLYCSGRKDGQIKYKGYRIELGDVESNLAALPGVNACAVVPRIGAGGEVLALRAFAAADPGVTEAGLKEALAKRLPAYMIPKTIRLIDRLPVTENGKTDRKALECL